METNDLVVCDLRKLIEGERFPAFPKWALGKIHELLSPNKADVEIIYPHSHQGRLLSIGTGYTSVLAKLTVEKPTIQDNILEIILFLAKSDYEKSKIIENLEGLVDFNHRNRNL